MSLRISVIKGIQWTTLGTIFLIGIQFIRHVILAHLLTPDDFGIMALVLMVCGFIQPLINLGLSAAIIQNEFITPQQLSTLYWLNILMGFLSFAILYFSAPFVGQFFSSELLPTYVRISAIVFLVSPWGTQYTALLTKALRFKQIQGITIFSAVFSFITAVILALMNFGVLSLVIAFITASATTSILNVIIGFKEYKPSFYFNLREVRNLLKFGLFHTGTGITNFFAANIDNLFIGKFIGTYELGLYSVAWNLIVIPVRRINPILNSITFPVFSKLKLQHEKISKYFASALIALIIINFPIYIILAGLSNNFLQLVYGDPWQQASIVLTIMSFVGLTQSFANPGGGVVLAKGRADIGFYWTIGWLFSLSFIISLSIVINPTIESVAVAHLITALTIGPVWHVLVHRIGRINYIPILKSLGKLIPAVLPIYFSLFFIKSLVNEPSILMLGVEVFVACLVYLSYILIFLKTELKTIKQLVIK